MYNTSNLAGQELDCPLSSGGQDEAPLAVFSCAQPGRSVGPHSCLKRKDGRGPAVPHRDNCSD